MHHNFNVWNILWNPCHKQVRLFLEQSEALDRISAEFVPNEVWAMCDLAKTDRLNV